MNAGYQIELVCGLRHFLGILHIPLQCQGPLQLYRKSNGIPSLVPVSRLILSTLRESHGMEDLSSSIASLRWCSYW